MGVKDVDLIKFVELCNRPMGARKKDLPPATREQDAVRQLARKSGLVVFEDRGHGKRWFATGEVVKT